MLLSPLSTSADGENYRLKSLSREGAEMLGKQLEPVNQAERASGLWQWGWHRAGQGGSTDSSEFAGD